MLITPLNPEDGELVTVGFGSLVHKFFPSSLGISIFETQIDQIPSSFVSPTKIASLSTFSSHRSAEFYAGRYCAHKAMQQLGVQEIIEIPHDKNHAPIWPIGLTGSISHSQYRAIAVAGWATQVLGLGIDILPVSEDIGLRQYLLFCTSHELEALQNFFDIQRHFKGLALLSAKEAAFKCIYHTTGKRVDLRTISILWEPIGTGFTAYSSCAEHIRLYGNQLVANQHFYTGVYSIHASTRNS